MSKQMRLDSSVSESAETLCSGRRASFEAMRNDTWKSATVAAASPLPVFHSVSGRRKIAEEPSAVPHKGQDDDGVGDVKALDLLQH